MGFLKEIESLDDRNVLSYCFFLASTLFSGFLVLVRYKPDLITSLDTLKLLLLSVAITIPTWGITYLLLLPAVINNNGVNLNGVFLSSSIINSLLFWVCLLITYFCRYNLNSFIIWIFLGETCILIIITISIIFKSDPKDNRPDAPHK